jgi:hypothetical protein
MTTRLLLIAGVAVIVLGCTGGTFIQYPAFPTTSCSTCPDQKR